MKSLWIEFGIVGVVSFLLSTVLTYLIIPILKGKKAGQKILEIGPRWHKSKEGTPTMGGIAFIMAMLLTLLGMAIYYGFHGLQSLLIPLALTVALAVLNGMIGFVDDFCKLMKKQNQGLKPHQKSLLQVLTAILYLVALRMLGYADTTLHIPFTELHVELGLVWYVFAVFVIVGMVNSVNLTDGIDGLAGSVTLVVACFFGLVGMNVLYPSLTLLSGVLVGGILGFLVFNFHPARVFMGDTGSLFLGGAVTGAAFMLNEPIIILIVGGVYVLEAVSVILQVGSFKLRNKRIFKMAPIHHHFEKSGWSEWTIVIVFSLVTVALCAVAALGL